MASSVSLHHHRSGALPSTAQRTAAAPTSSVAPPTTLSSTLVPSAPLLHAPPLPSPQSATKAFNQLTTAIYGMQQQHGEPSLRVTALEGRPGS